MTYRLGSIAPLALAFLLLCDGATVATAQQQQREEQHRGGAAPHAAAPRPAAPRAERYRGPQRYHEVTAPKGWNARPKTFNRSTYQHNFQAQRSFRIGPYRPPAGWVARRWVYGQTLPRAFWAQQYVVADYWLFGLEVPPVGYAWIRYGADALLVNMTTGQILQVEYGLFA